MDVQLPRQLNKPLYFTKYCTSGAWLYNNKQTKMGPKEIWDTQYLAIFLVATTEERGAAAWRVEARLLQPGCQHPFPDPPLSACGAGGQVTQSICCCWLWDPATIAPNYPLLWMTQGASIPTPFLLWGINGWRRPLATAVTKPAFRGTSSRNKLPHDLNTFPKSERHGHYGATVKEPRVGHMTTPTGRGHHHPIFQMRTQTSGSSSNLGI